MLGVLLRYPKLLGVGALVVLLGAGYYNWKDSIEDAVLAKVRLDAMMEAEEYKQKKYKQSQQLIKEMAVKERSLELAALNLSAQLKRGSDETSCINKPLSDDDVRLLNFTFSFKE
jgi:hypothetical protein